VLVDAPAIKNHVRYDDDLTAGRDNNGSIIRDVKSTANGNAVLVDGIRKRDTVPDRLRPSDAQKVLLSREPFKRLQRRKARGDRTLRHLTLNYSFVVEREFVSLVGRT
jgi:hypothetical protein